MNSLPETKVVPDKIKKVAVQKVSKEPVSKEPVIKAARKPKEDPKPISMRYCSGGKTSEVILDHKQINKFEKFITKLANPTPLVRRDNKQNPKGSNDASVTI